MVIQDTSLVIVKVHPPETENAPTEMGVLWSQVAVTGRERVYAVPGDQVTLRPSHRRRQDNNQGQ